MLTSVGIGYQAVVAAIDMLSTGHITSSFDFNIDSVTAATEIAEANILASLLGIPVSSRIDGIKYRCPD